MGGLARCVSCGEVHWSLRLRAPAGSVQECRVCGAELRAERRRPGRRFGRPALERRDLPGAGEAGRLGHSRGS